MQWSTLPLTVVKQLMSSSSVIALLPIVQRWGLKTLGEFCGPYRQRSCSVVWGPTVLSCSELRVVRTATPSCQRRQRNASSRRWTLEWPVDGLEPLSFVLGRVLEPLCAQLDSCGVSVGALRVRLTLVSRDTHERTLRFSSAGQ